MNTKKITKIISILVLIAMLIGTFATVNATSVSIPSASAISGTSLETIVPKIIWIVQFICYAAAVILLMTLGVKILTAAPEAKAEIKKSAVYYIVGAVMVFAAGIILNVITSITSNLK